MDNLDNENKKLLFIKNSESETSVDNTSFSQLKYTVLGQYKYFLEYNS